MLVPRVQLLPARATHGGAFPENYFRNIIRDPRDASSNAPLKLASHALFYGAGPIQRSMRLLTKMGGTHHVQTKLLLRMRLTHRTLTLASLDKQKILHGLCAALSSNANLFANRGWRNALLRWSSSRARHHLIFAAAFNGRARRVTGRQCSGEER